MMKDPMVQTAAAASVLTLACTSGDVVHVDTTTTGLNGQPPAALTPGAGSARLTSVHVPRHLGLPLAVLLAGCGNNGATTGFSGGSTPVMTLPADESGSSTADSSSSTSSGDSSSSSSSTSTTGSSSGNTIWDMGMPDFDPTQPAGCDGRIDFLFVISTAATMKVAQDRLTAAVPGFIATIQEQFSEFDVHVLVASTDVVWNIGDCGLCEDGCDPMGQPPACGAVVTPCDKKIGAGVTFPAGMNASNRRCELGGDLRYIVSGQQDMAEAFTCIAQVGTSGAARGGEAMAAALQPEMNDPDDEDACNRGFLRDDALLVVTIIQDTYDEDSLGTVDEWIAALRKAKHDDDDAFAVLVLTTDVDVDYGQLCHPNEFIMYKNRLRLLVEGMEHGFIDSICKDEFVSFFAEHANDLVELCDDFVPPG
ncbi:MAG: hypothetical protein JNL82_08465 [Myxococcales bacterium]|nr:hypothetical protein [Myxococcales bacterium]